MQPVHTILFKFFSAIFSFVIRRVKLFTFIVMILNILLFVYLDKHRDRDWVIVSGLGGKCLDIENKDFFNGAKLIAYKCDHENNNQKFSIVNKKLMFQDKCVEALYDKKNQRDFLALRNCREDASQEWKYHNHYNTITNANGKCIDILGGAQYFYEYQITTLWTCSLANNQKWYLSKYISKNNIQVAKEKIVRTGKLGEIQASDLVVAEASGNLQFTKGFRDGYLLSGYESSVIDTGSDEYLVPAGKIDSFSTKQKAEQ